MSVSAAIRSSIRGLFNTRGNAPTPVEALELLNRG